jgi:hypothetical protein
MNQKNTCLRYQLPVFQTFAWKKTASTMPISAFFISPLSFDYTPDKASDLRQQKYARESIFLRARIYK